MAKRPVDVDPAGENAAGETPSPEPDAVTDDATVYDDDVELERTIGLVGGLAIGIGTMIGAGIFVFPGLAAENAGLAATLSFAIGGLIALLVALPTSELATAMPRSGGGYYFISRGMGTAYGAVVGLGLVGCSRPRSTSSVSATTRAPCSSNSASNYRVLPSSGSDWCSASR
jgi:Amino acid transporters